MFFRKINNIPEFYMIFARKMPEFYLINQSITKALVAELLQG